MTRHFKAFCYRKTLQVIQSEIERNLALFEKFNKYCIVINLQVYTQFLFFSKYKERCKTELFPFKNDSYCVINIK